MDCVSEMTDDACHDRLDSNQTVRETSDLPSTLEKRARACEQRELLCHRS